MRVSLITIFCLGLMSGASFAAPSKCVSFLDSGAPPLAPVTSENPLSYDLFLRLYDQARKLAIGAHQGQFYDGRPYEYHLAYVEAKLRLAGYDPVTSVDARELIIAAWLHDIVEDTPMTIDVLENIFGKSIALLVSSVTAIRNEAGLSDELWDIQCILNVRNHRLGPALKVADRLANVETGVRTNGVKTKYVRTYATFRAELGPDFPYLTKSAEELWLWQHLDRLMGL